MVQDNFDYVCFFDRYPLKGSQSHLNMRSQVTAVSYLHNGVNDTTVHITAVSMTPLCMSQRCQWLPCACHSGVNDTAVPCAAESDFFIKTVCQIIRKDIPKKLVTQQCQWLHCACHSGVNDSMTPLCLSQQCQWLRCACHSGVNYTAVQPTLSIIFADSKPYLKRL
jgi:hypothetical protein